MSSSSEVTEEQRRIVRALSQAEAKIPAGVNFFLSGLDPAKGMARLKIDGHGQLGAGTAVSIPFFEAMDAAKDTVSCARFERRVLAAEARMERDYRLLRATRPSRDRCEAITRRPEARSRARQSHGGGATRTRGSRRSTSSSSSRGDPSPAGPSDGSSDPPRPHSLDLTRSGA